MDQNNTTKGRDATSPDTRTIGLPAQSFLDFEDSAIRSISLSRLQDCLVVGRGEAADFRVMDPLLSRKHFEFFKTEAGWHVRDLNSKNGTQLNGESLEEEARVIVDEDIVTAGTSIFQIELDSD